MNKIKIDYKVDKSKTTLKIKENIKNFIIKLLHENKEIEERKLVFISIRISYKNIKTKYALVLQENIDITKLDSSEITKEFFNRLNNRKVNIDDLSSIHFHMFLS